MLQELETHKAHFGLFRHILRWIIIPWNVCWVGLRFNFLIVHVGRRKLERVFFHLLKFKALRFVLAVALWLCLREGGPVCWLPVRRPRRSAGGVLLQRLRWCLLWEDLEREQTERVGPQHPAGLVSITRQISCELIYTACICSWNAVQRSKKYEK